MQVAVAPPRVPVGRVKTFGLLGPKYQVGEPTRQLDDGDWLVKVTIVETGETVEYRWSRLSDDPRAD
jgi:hypothetical protein